MIFIVYFLIIFIVFKYFMSVLNDPSKHRKLDISIVFGAPGNGKTTVLARFAEQACRNKDPNKWIPVYTTIDLDYPNCIKIDRSDIGKYLMRDCLILVDEAGVDFNNRNYKSTSDALIKYLKYHRHFCAQLVFFSQSYEDMDITIRRLAQRYYLVKKTLFNKITHRFSLRRIKKIIDIRKEDRQIVDCYDFVFLSKFRFCGKKYFKHFNSYETYFLPDLTTKDKNISVLKGE